ncbi:hypothetical protein GCM10010172_80170 [Paractinoplanes ferrugineus]|uniref:Uncharacterized protein n=1 Tax=Paractinoplanes ferrugineus TaxID=113564 RepID=A0A919J9P6_9ACTN|nr:hypothetical protein [Actinoplanes ferrugineus]GIE16733.1 hypothetical protein Afe05nite_85730 [Actinoplanes ferrugineus]
MTTPESCRWCDGPKQGHGQRYTTGIGWHAYEAPETELIEARMQAKYGLDAATGMDDEYHRAGVYCGEPSHCTEPFPGALPGMPYHKVRSQVGGR